METEQLLFFCIVLFAVGALSALVPVKTFRFIPYLFSLAGSLTFLFLGLILTGITPVSYQALSSSSIFEFSLRGDALAGFFIITISLVASAVSVYSIGFTRNSVYASLSGFFINVLILSLYAVVLSANLFTFLISWETMAIASYFLVTLDRSEEASRAGLFYAVMTHIGTAFIIALFFILYRATNRMDFEGMKAGITAMPTAVKTIIFIFALIGFGTKAGIVPLHTWIPRAYTVVPPHVAALMSGLMVKMGIYGFLRISFDVLGQGPEWWGITVISVGAVSALLGILYGIIENDLKRFLAYSSVENVGIILLGIGASMMFKSNGLAALSSLALTAALFHVLNHALFKGVLFLGAGSIIHSSGTGNMEHMGGLLKRMPVTGLFFLSGALSICALPPFNGFVSEWLTYQALLLGYQSPSITAKIVSPLGGAALALTGAIAAAGFVKAFGITLLGAPRSDKSRDAEEVSFSMLAGMAILAVPCLVFGLIPGPALSLLMPAVYLLTGASTTLEHHGVLGIGQTSAALSPIGMLVTMIVMMIAVLVFIRIRGGKRKIVYADSWDCGISGLTPRMQYTATAFTKPIRIIYKRIYLPSRDIKVQYFLKPFFVKSIRYGGEITPFFERYVYEPATRFIQAVASKAKLLQSGSLNLYLAYILITLILLLIFAT
ncbi:MAG TPA: proton-conducting transporter membrane subunit [Nitrospirota bacterium]|nr:proton-conducting transporter membrane subunit [Nitrospirota bacterium]